MRSSDVGRNAITGTKVRDGALSSADFAAGQLPAGPQGSAGPQGPAGAQGPAGPQGPAGSDAQFNGAVAGGDLTDTYPNPTVATDAIRSAEVADGSLRLRETAKLSGSLSINPPSVAANGCEDFSAPVTGVSFGDVTYLRPSANLQDGLIVGALSGNDDVLVYTICNVTNGPLDSLSGNWRYVVWQG